MYHYVKPFSLADGEEPWFLPLVHFEKQLDWFASKGRILHPQQLLEPGFQPAEDDFLLTFDDGLADHFQVVYPVLQRRGVSALFFLNGLNYQQERLLNVHRIHVLIRHIGLAAFEREIRTLLSLDALQPSFVNRFKDAAYQGLAQQAALSSVKAQLNFYLLPADQDTVLSALMQQAGLDEKAIAAAYYITQQQAAEMQAAGMCFGGHGYTHYVLSNLSATQQAEEVRTCMNWLQQWLPSSPLPVFCFPYGYAQSYNADTIAALKQASVQVGLGVENRPVSEADWQQGRLHLPRLDCNRFIFSP